MDSSFGHWAADLPRRDRARLAEAMGLEPTDLLDGSALAAGAAALRHGGALLRGPVERNRPGWGPWRRFAVGTAALVLIGFGTGGLTLQIAPAASVASVASLLAGLALAYRLFVVPRATSRFPEARAVVDLLRGTPSPSSDPDPQGHPAELRRWCRIFVEASQSHVQRRRTGRPSLDSVAGRTAPGRARRLVRFVALGARST